MASVDRAGSPGTTSVSSEQSTCGSHVFGAAQDEREGLRLAIILARLKKHIEESQGVSSL